MAILKSFLFPKIKKWFEPMFLLYHKFCLCAGEESNLHAFRHIHLKDACMPFHHPRVILVSSIKYQVSRDYSLKCSSFLKFSFFRSNGAGLFKLCQ